MTINSGELVGLIGPNGAGKTTVFNLLTGVYQPTEGEFFLDGERMNGKKTYQVVRAGIARTFQNIRLFGQMTALENVMAGHHIRTKAGVWGILTQNKHTREEERLTTERAYELLRYVGIQRFADVVSKNLSYGDQRRLEIARALATEPQLLALDEPAAGMNATETGQLKQLIQQIRNDGITVMLIEHDVKLVMGLCDRVAVLDFGKKIAEDVPAVVQKDDAVIAAYLGGGKHAH
jgi:branched-chain amino acid transport system ATP-binding protein